MKWSWKILSVYGIAIYVHVTFLLLPLWVGWSQFSVRHRWADAWAGVGFVLLLFGIVVLHELGHALTARRFGIRTRDITLLPIGGVARLERMPEEPKQELLVALAGPAVNVCLALLCFALLGAGQQVALWTEMSPPGAELLVGLMWVNVALAVFNLVPAFPMDGGRVLRALLATRLSYARATRVAAGIGRGMALVFAFLGLSSLLLGPLGPLSNPFLLLIGLFVWMGATQEAQLVEMKCALGGVPVSQVMITDFRTLSAQAPLVRAVQQLIGGWQHDFPVLDQGRLVGLLTRSALVDGLAQRGLESTVAESMVQQLFTIDASEPVEAALGRLRAGEDRLLVVSGGELLGMLDRENVGEYLLVQAALHGLERFHRQDHEVEERQAA